MLCWFGVCVGFVVVVMMVFAVAVAIGTVGAVVVDDVDDVVVVGRCGRCCCCCCCVTDAIFWLMRRKNVGDAAPFPCDTAAPAAAVSRPLSTRGGNNESGRHNTGLEVCDWLVVVTVPLLLLLHMHRNLSHSGQRSMSNCRTDWSDSVFGVFVCCM